MSTSVIPKIPKEYPIRKVNFYYDGFNFYNGLKDAKWKYYYWLDIVTFSQKLIGKYKNWEVNKVNYYTANPYNYGKKIRQNILLDANTKLHSGKFEVKLGKYSNKTIQCGSTCKENFQHPEEKGADVGIAVDMIGDFLLKKCDVTILISGDNDQIPTLRFIKNQDPHHKVIVFFPPNRHKNSLGMHCSSSSHLLTSPHMFAQAILPPKINHADGTFSIKPPEWPNVPI